MFAIIGLCACRRPYRISGKILGSVGPVRDHWPGPVASELRGVGRARGKRNPREINLRPTKKGKEKVFIFVCGGENCQNIWRRCPVERAVC